MKYFIARVFVIAAILGITGCISNPLNIYTAQKYYSLAQEAERNGDLERACMFYSRSYGNAQLGMAWPLGKAYALYGFSRLSGYLGRFEVAEKGFNDVIALLDESKEDTRPLRAPTYAEHARLVLDDGRYAESISLFEKAVAALDAISTEEKYPADYAAFLDTYASALKKSGREGEAATLANRANQIRATHPNAQIQFIPHKYKRADQVSAPTATAHP